MWLLVANKPAKNKNIDIRLLTIGNKREQQSEKEIRVKYKYLAGIHVHPFSKISYF